MRRTSIKTLSIKADMFLRKGEACGCFIAGVGVVLGAIIVGPAVVDVVIISVIVVGVAIIAVVAVFFLGRYFIPERTLVTISLLIIIIIIIIITPIGKSMPLMTEKTQVACHPPLIWCSPVCSNH